VPKNTIQWCIVLVLVSRCSKPPRTGLLAPSSVAIMI